MLPMHGIESDVDRFHQIIKGRIKDNLKKYITRDDLIGKSGNDKITIPLPRIDLPRFIHSQDSGGVGQGQGADGDEPGNLTPENTLEVDVTLEELADMLGEQLQLPRLLPKGKSDIFVEDKQYKSIRKVGPESLRSFKRTYKEALKRTISADEYDEEDPIILPIKEDRRYRSSTPIIIPQNQAVIFYFLDVSGSMGNEEKTRARLASFWIDVWLRKHYKNIQSRYIIHHFEAKEVDQKTFYSTMEGGGTRIASAYELCRDILKVEYADARDWNAYIFQYSDGDDWSPQATQEAMDVIKDLTTKVNQISYCQVASKGPFLEKLKQSFPGKDSKVVWAIADSSEKIVDAIKKFFEKGK